MTISESLSILQYKGKFSFSGVS